MKKPFLFLWLVAGAAVLFSWIYLPAISRYQDLKTRQEGIEIQTKNLQAKLKDIREERDLLKNDAGYLEKVIREELGLVKPGEIVYKFVEEKPAPKPAAKPVPLEDSVAEGAVPPGNPAVPAKPSPVPALTVPAALIQPRHPERSEGSKTEILQHKTLQDDEKSAEPAYPRQETR